MNPLLILFLIIGAGQQPVITYPDTCAENRFGIDAKCPSKPAAPAPLKCGKYQRTVKSPTQSCKADPSDKTGMIVICEDTNPPYCEDIMHVVTEAEWQGWLLVQKTQQEVNAGLKEYILANDAQRKLIERRLRKLESRVPKEGKQ